MLLSLIFFWQVLSGLKNQKSGNVSKSESTPLQILGLLLDSLSYFPLRAAVYAGYAFAIVAPKFVILYCSKNEKQF